MDCRTYLLHSPFPTVCSVTNMAGAVPVCLQSRWDDSSATDINTMFYGGLWSITFQWQCLIMGCIFCNKYEWNVPRCIILQPRPIFVGCFFRDTCITCVHNVQWRIILQLGSLSMGLAIVWWALSLLAAHFSRHRLPRHHNPQVQKLLVESTRSLLPCLLVSSLVVKY